MDADPKQRESCLLKSRPDAPVLARRFLCDTLADWGVADASGDLALLTSELVTNSVRHAHSDIALTIERRNGCLRVGVHDCSTSPPVLGDIEAAREGGWGLHIVERLAARWGLEPDGSGKTVWCEVPAARR